MAKGSKDEAKTTNDDNEQEIRRMETFYGVDVCVSVLWKRMEWLKIYYFYYVFLDSFVWWWLLACCFDDDDGGGGGGGIAILYICWCKQIKYYGQSIVNSQWTGIRVCRSGGNELYLADDVDGSGIHFFLLIFTSNLIGL